MAKVNGMAAYRNHKQPAKGMEDYWNKKEALIADVMSKYNINRNDLSVKTVEQLEDILQNGITMREDKQEILRFN